jgi:hypothetical protein
MDADRYDAFTRSLTASPTRRRVLATAGVTIVTLATGWPSHGAAAKHKHKHKLALNQYGCVDVGGKCHGKSSVCCSGICQGSKKRGTCVAHDVGDCTTSDNSCPSPAPCQPNPNGTISGFTCYLTTGKASICAFSGTCHCGGCKKDSDCQKRQGPGAACIICDSDCPEGKGTACVGGIV